ncbi:Arc family DNA-binding protein [Vogesella indigofera]|uniref:Arc family DNA-binding protein n=1 Tax=Vogesella indigofera TaxID=45465 RepID=UPI00234D234B|nr:Arc family DNA-binding protein [Vogesella indigofera]MDC7704054.1 Arc family DNA-binding protein [Vogesella indigofera]
MKDARKAPQTNLRMSHELKDWLQKKSEKNFRSMNSEVIARLEESRRREEENDEQRAA